MQNSPFSSVQTLLQTTNRWLLRTPERALNQAYTAALKIRALEEAHFGGRPISAQMNHHSKSAQSYFQGELKKYLDVIKLRLIEFKASSSIVRLSKSVADIQAETLDRSSDQSEDRLDQNTIDVDLPDYRSDDEAKTISETISSSISGSEKILQKLRFVDETVARYQAVMQPAWSTPAASAVIRSDALIPADNLPADDLSESSSKSLTRKTGVLPRSILDTVDRIKRDLDPEAEQTMVQDFRKSKSRTVISLRFILLLVLIPLLVQQAAKNFVIGPLIDQVRAGEQHQIFLNDELEEAALSELQRYEQRLRFESLIGKAPPLEDAELTEKIQEKAAEIEQQYRNLSSDAIKNVFADMLALAAFAGLILTSKREIAILKSFMDQLVYGLSDSAKAFVIILLTDMFVGFHSPHGWEVLLEGLSRHLGLPANRDFIFLFIATFPVILDTIFKYWIFRYLNRVSPSAVATYRNMNE